MVLDLGKGIQSYETFYERKCDTRLQWIVTVLNLVIFEGFIAFFSKVDALSPNRTMLGMKQLRRVDRQ